MRGDAELASVMRKLILDGVRDGGYVNQGHWNNHQWITVDVRQVPITEEEAQAIEEATP